MNILNQHLPCDGLEVSRKLQKLMLKMKGEFMKEDGSGVHYSRLKESALYRTYEETAVDLQHADLTSLSEDERKAFFINVYNALTIHGLTKCETLPKSVLDVEKFWRNTGYIIGGHAYSLDDIEHGVLRGNRPHPSSPELFFKDGDPRLPFVITSLDPRIHFALVCGAKSCPPISVYSGTNINHALDAAAKSYLGSEVRVDSEAVIHLPKLLQWYRTDFGSTAEEVVSWHYNSRQLLNGKVFETARSADYAQQFMDKLWVLPFVEQQTKEKIRLNLSKLDSPDLSISYNDYNWHLNSVD